MRAKRDAHSLRAALEEVTPAAPHLVHTVMAAVRVAASEQAPRRATRRRIAHPLPIAAVLAAVLVTLLIVSVYWAGAIGRLAAGVTRSTGHQAASFGYKSMDSFSLGSAVSANEAWIVQFHESVYETQPGFYRTQPGTTPFSIVSGRRMAGARGSGSCASTACMTRCGSQPTAVAA